MELLDKINDVIPGPQDAPLDEILITQCGVTDHQGQLNFNSEDGQKRRADDPEHTVQQLREHSRRTQNELRHALNMHSRAALPLGLPWRKD